MMKWSERDFIGHTIETKQFATIVEAVSRYNKYRLTVRYSMRAGDPSVIT